MPSNPYAAPAAALDHFHAKDVFLFTPNQVAVGAFLGGPVAGMYFLHANFKQLDALEAARQTLIWGAIVLVALVALIAVLPEGVPGMPFAIAYTLGARYVAERYQLSKEAIFDTGHHFQSNWKVFGISLLSVAGSLAVIFAMAFVLAAAGVL